MIRTVSICAVLARARIPATSKDAVGKICSVINVAPIVYMGNEFASQALVSTELYLALMDVLTSSAAKAAKKASAFKDITKRLHWCSYKI